jgi:hypothetical protein
MFWADKFARMFVSRMIIRLRMARAHWLADDFREIADAEGAMRAWMVGQVKVSVRRLEVWVLVGDSAGVFGVAHAV